MSCRIVILDDEPHRIDEMKRCLSKNLLGDNVVIFDNAPEMIAWLRQFASRANLICLDHDLGPNRTVGGLILDPGIGRDVADYLATIKPVCPVIVHTTNSLAAPGMKMILEDAGWSCYAVVPYDDVRWIREVWLDAVKASLGPNC
jgi:hypothetical protein